MLLKYQFFQHNQNFGLFCWISPFFFVIPKIVIGWVDSCSEKTQFGVAYLRWDDDLWCLQDMQQPIRVVEFRNSFCFSSRNILISSIKLRNRCSVNPSLSYLTSGYPIFAFLNCRCSNNFKATKRLGFIIRNTNEFNNRQTLQTL